MKFQLSIQPGDHQFEGDSDNTILNAASDAGLLLPHSCRDGVCGSCKGRVVSGQVDYGMYAESALSQAEKNSGYALFCCAKPRSDLQIEVRQISRKGDIPVKKLVCRVEQLEQLADDVMRMKVKLPASYPFQFLPGQYVDFFIEGNKRRSFSIASAPQHNGFIDFHIRLIDDGRFTRHVFNTMKEKEILRFEGPLGSFYLREAADEGGDRPIVLLAGGTGFAPIQSILDYAITHRLTRPMHLYWGARDRAGLYLFEHAKNYEIQLPGFKFTPVISDKPDNWSGRTGLVHAAVAADYADLSKFQVYACGAPAMIDVALKTFVEQCSLPAEHFFADSFAFANEP